MAYICFKRDWWRDNPKYPNGLEPHAGAKSYFKNKVFDTEQEAREFCQEYNENNDAGRYSRKMEFEELDLRVVTPRAHAAPKYQRYNY
jgi:hypothetical protein